MKILQEGLRKLQQLLSDKTKKDSLLRVFLFAIVFKIRTLGVYL